LSKFFYLILFSVWVATGCSTHQQTIGRNAAVTMYLEVGNAAKVEFVCSLDEFRHRPMVRIDNNTWSIHVPASHYFTYYYLVDGEAHIPDCRLRETDDFGSENCIYEPTM